MKRALITIAIITFAPVAFACSCGRTGSFIQSAGPLVFAGAVDSYITAKGRPQPVAMNVEVRRVLRGTYNAKTIRIIGDFGISCVPYVSNFPIGTVWVFAVGGPYEVPGLGDENFSFGMCAMNWLPLIGVRASGYVGGRIGSAELTLGELEALLRDRNATVDAAPPFASVRSSTESGITAPALRGQATLALEKPCQSGDEQIAVNLVIDATGAVRDFQLEKKQMSPCVAAAAYNTVRRWQFTPASRSGHPIAVRHRVVLTTSRSAAPSAAPSPKSPRS